MANSGMLSVPVTVHPCLQMLLEWRFMDFCPLLVAELQCAPTHAVCLSLHPSHSNPRTLRHCCLTALRHPIVILPPSSSVFNPPFPLTHSNPNPQDSAILLPDSITSSFDELLHQLRSLAPSGSHDSFDMGSLLHAVEEVKVGGSQGQGAG